MPSAGAHADVAALSATASNVGTMSFSMTLFPMFIETTVRGFSLSAAAACERSATRPLPCWTAGTTADWDEPTVVDAIPFGASQEPDEDRDTTLTEVD